MVGTGLLDEISSLVVSTSVIGSGVLDEVSVLLVNISVVFEIKDNCEVVLLINVVLVSDDSGKSILVKLTISSVIWFGV